MTKQLTVLQVLPALESGGVEKGTLEVGRYLVEKGHRSIVMSAGGRLVPTLLEQGSEHVELAIGKKSLLTFRYIRFLRRYFIENHVDILHLRSRMPAWVCYLAWRGMDRATRPRLITTVHGLYSVNAYSQVMTKGERVIVVSETVKNYVMQHYAVDEAKIKLNYRGVDRAIYPFAYRVSREWLTDWDRTFPETKGKMLVTLPGRVSRLKGQHDLLTLLNRLKADMPNVHGLIVGEVKPGKEAYLAELKAAAVRLGIEENVTFTGHRSDLREIMAISTLVLSLSTEPEAFGRVSLEALSLGIPVVAYGHGGVGEQLQKLLPEGHVDVGDMAQLVARTSTWLRKPPMLKEHHDFSLENMVNNTLSIYQESVASLANVNKKVA